MSNIWSVVLDLLRLKAGPEDPPDHRGLTLLLIGLYVAQGVIASESLGGEHEPARTLVSVGLQFGVIAAILYWRRQPERLQQTFMAFATTGIVIGLLAFMLLLQADSGVNQPLLALVWFALLGWSLAVEANIFRHALDISLPLGMLVTVMLFAVNYLAIELLFR